VSRQVRGSAGEETPAADAALLALFDVLGRRWAMRIVWELRAGAMTYRELATRVPDMSTSVLTQRLRELRAARLVEHERGTGYRLAPQGGELLGHLAPLREWAARVEFAAKPPPE
jgi:DNA-binding HxlR family transcriptional regulator